MKLAFFTNFLNHHQYALCKALQSHVEQFKFIATKPIPQRRLDFGYKDFNDYDFVIKAYEEQNAQQVDKVLRESDVVIFGDRIESYLEKRMQENKLSFLFTERFLKKGWWQKFKPSTRKRIKNKTSRYNGKEFYLLCAGAYVASDAKYFGFENDMYRWAYFTEVEQFDVELLLAEKQNREVVKILWAGRFKDWKRPQDAIKLAHELKKQNLNFELEMLGSGKLEKKMQNLAKKYNLNDCVKFLGSIPADQVRDKMKQADIFLQTSDQHEGWGAVINEAMNSSCCVVCSRGAGSGPTLIEHGHNGYLYDFKNFAEFVEVTKSAIQNKQARLAVAKNAYQTMVDLWSPEIAADRFVKLARLILEAQTIDLPTCGPCSKALEL